MSFARIWQELKDFFIPDGKPRILTNYLKANELIALINREGIYCAISVDDRDYAPLQWKWVEGTGYNFYVRTLDKLGVKGWRQDHDCDNWARFFADLVCICHHNSRTNIESPAVGFIKYKTDRGGYHAINIVVIEDNKVVFFEPLTGEFVSLKRTEFNSIFYAHF